MAFGRGARCASRRPRELNPRAHILRPGLRFELSRRPVAKRPPAPKAFSAATLEIAWVCTGREPTGARLSLAPISRAARKDDVSHASGGAPRGPAGNAAGPGRLEEWEQPLEN